MSRLQLKSENFGRSLVGSWSLDIFEIDSPVLIHIFTASLLETQHLRDNEKIKLTSCLLVLGQGSCS